MVKLMFRQDLLQTKIDLNPLFRNSKLSIEKDRE